tara:strand:- start:1324 stop:1506 length:183 start_codon:yes stop_codon:yes gene_type:complete
MARRFGEDPEVKLTLSRDEFMFFIDDANVRLRTGQWDKLIKHFHKLIDPVTTSENTNENI